MATTETWEYAGVRYTADAETGKVECVRLSDGHYLGHKDLARSKDPARDECAAMERGERVAARALLRWEAAIWNAMDYALRWYLLPAEEHRGKPPYRDAVEALRRRGLVVGEATVPGCKRGDIGALDVRLTEAGRAVALDAGWVKAFLKVWTTACCSAPRPPHGDDAQSPP